MIELGVSTGPEGPRVERRNYSAIQIAALEAWSTSGVSGAVLGAVEIAARMFAAAFASATVEPAGPRTAALTPALLADVARRLVAQGESLHVVEVAGGQVALLPASSWSVVGGARPDGWRYMATVSGPSTTTTTYTRAQVAHSMYATLPARPWQGVGPLALAGETGRLGRLLERSLADEAGGPVGSLIPMPTDAGEDGEDDPLGGLKREIAGLRGRVGLVETSAAGWGEGRAAAPAQDWEPRRIGANPPATLATLRQAVESTVLAVCGVPPDLARPGGRTRESFRQWVAASVQPLARLVAAEFAQALDVDGLRLRFDGLGAADVTGRARAYRSLVGPTGEPMPDADARRIAGLD